MEFQAFPKIARLRREVVVTEKIDGTNAAVIVAAPNTWDKDDVSLIASVDGYGIFAQSRKRLITPSDDNFGFASWVQANAPDLAQLGDGSHFGEWWGRSIQRNYGLTEKRFSLFNAGRWADGSDRPSCCHVVPTLYRGPFDLARINGAMTHLQAVGSLAAPGFMNPEGIVVFHTAGGGLFKITYEHDETGKEAA